MSLGGHDDDILKELDLGSDGAVKAGGRRPRRYMGMGASSILMVFIILCLTTFAILTLVSSLADYRITGKVRDSVVRYYAADAVTDGIIKEIDGLLLFCRGQVKQEPGGLYLVTEYESLIALTAEKINNELALNNDIRWHAAKDADAGSVKINESTGRIVITVPTGDGRTVETVMNITGPEFAARYSVTSRCIIAESDAEEDDGWNFFIP